MIAPARRARSAAHAVPDLATGKTGNQRKVIKLIMQCLARSACVIGVATDGDERVDRLCSEVLWVPPCPDELLVPAVVVIHLRLLAR